MSTRTMTRRPGKTCRGEEGAGGSAARLDQRPGGTAAQLRPVGGVPEVRPVIPRLLAEQRAADPVPNARRNPGRRVPEMAAAGPPGSQGRESHPDLRLQHQEDHRRGRERRRRRKAGPPLPHPVRVRHRTDRPHRRRTGHQHRHRTADRCRRLRRHRHPHQLPRRGRLDASNSAPSTGRRTGTPIPKK